MLVTNLVMGLSMSDESHRRGRPLRAEEQAVLVALLGSLFEDIDEKLRTSVVEDMADGWMGSIRFLHESSEGRVFGATIAEAEYLDSDGIPVSIAVNVDGRGDLFEVDIWKVDFSPLRDYPTPERLQLKAKSRATGSGATGSGR